MKKDWKATEREPVKGEREGQTYFAAKSCYNCGGMMQTLYFRDKNHLFCSIGLICFNCRSIDIFPDKLEKDIQNSTGSKARPEEREKDIQNSRLQGAPGSND